MKHLIHTGTRKGSTVYDFTEISQLMQASVNLPVNHIFNFLRTTIKQYVSCFHYPIVKGHVYVRLCIVGCFIFRTFNLKDWRDRVHTLPCILETWSCWKLCFWTIGNVSKLCAVLMLNYDTFVLQYEVSCVKRQVYIWFLFLRARWV